MRRDRPQSMPRRRRRRRRPKSAESEGQAAGQAKAAAAAVAEATDLLAKAKAEFPVNDRGFQQKVTEMMRADPGFLGAVSGFASNAQERITAALGTSSDAARTASIALTRVEKLVDARLTTYPPIASDRGDERLSGRRICMCIKLASLRKYIRLIITAYVTSNRTAIRQDGLYWLGTPSA